MWLSREEVLKLMFKGTKQEDIQSYISSNGVEVYITGKPNIKKLAELLVNLHK